ncbi:MAG TPA: hypothetical protein VF142_09600 [Longimicrobium sp.]
MTVETQNQLSSLQREVLSLLAAFGPSPSAVLHASVTGTVSYPRLTRSLGRLEALGLIEETTGARRTAWRLTSAAL